MKTELEILNDDEKRHLLTLLRKKKLREKDYRIINFKPLSKQEELISKVAETNELGEPLSKYLLYQGGNGAGKTIVGAYIAVCMALGYDGKKYGLPFLGAKRNIWIITKSGSNVKDVIMPYLLDEYSKTKIPSEEIAKHGIKTDNGILKSIQLVNGCKISIKTYDQGAENIQGGTPDFMWVDEDPVKQKIFDEILARLREKDGAYSQMLITMTPLSGYTPVYFYFYEQKNEYIESKMFTTLVNSLDNKYADNTALLGMTEEEQKKRIEGLFVPSSGLVYSQFNNHNNIVDYGHEGLGEDLVFYRAMDFGVSHPTAVLFIAVDGDGNILVYDEIYERNMLMRDIVNAINSKSEGIKFKYTITDTMKRERLELKALGLRTVAADKWSKGENNESNRRASIAKVNQLLFDGRLFVSRKCINLIKEFNMHFYKENGKKDGEVDKINDDALDALRYFIFSYKVPTIMTKKQKKWDKVFKENQKNNYSPEPY